MASEISLRPAGEFGVLVPVSVNGSGPHLFVLDTGATHTVIDADAAVELGLVVAAESAGWSAHGEMSVASASADLLIGGERLRSHPVAVADVRPTLAALQVESPEKPIGFLGHASLQDFRVSVDLARQWLLLEEPSESGDPHAVPSDWRWPTGPLVFQVRINGSGPVALRFDTGSGCTFIGTHAARRIGLNPQGRQAQAISGASHGSASLVETSLQFGNRVFDRHVVGVGDLGYLQAEALDGFLGFNILCVPTVIDYRQRSIEFRDV